MKFGLFDYIDRRDEEAAVTYDRRVEFVQAAEAAGFYGYHVTEHHVAPLSLTPSPAVFLSALARETSRIRLGALLFLLPLYNPLRLLEELCMLDQLSHGRLDLGVGRGISPDEFKAMHETFEGSSDTFDEVFEILMKGFTQERLNHSGKRWTYNNVKMVMKPYQKPHPALWYGLRGEQGAPFAAAHDMNAVSLGPTDRIAAHIARFRAAWRQHEPARIAAGAVAREPIIGAMRTVFVAESDAKAETLARPAYKKWFDNLAWLWLDNGGYPPIALSPDYDAALKSGSLVVGSPDTARRQLAAQTESCGFNYLLMLMAFGSLTAADEMNSLALFRDEVMPHLAAMGTPEAARRIA
jgi:alkanesulfonate monooxygenase SsuD/methylene tetrahydromethanopterin reductase-like flavin-dependent oxidoreductase (luciferase family)